MCTVDGLPNPVALDNSTELTMSASSGIKYLTFDRHEVVDVQGPGAKPKRPNMVEVALFGTDVFVEVELRPTGFSERRIRSRSELPHNSSVSTEFPALENTALQANKQWRESAINRIDRPTLLGRKEEEKRIAEEWQRRERIINAAQLRLAQSRSEIGETKISKEMQRITKTEGPVQAVNYALAHRDEMEEGYQQELDDASWLAREHLRPLLEAAQLLTNRPELAIKQFHWLIAKDPDWVEARHALNLFLSDRINEYGTKSDIANAQRYAKLGRYTADDAATDLPKETDLLFDQWNARLELAYFELFEGQADSAYSHFEEALCLGSSLPWQVVATGGVQISLAANRIWAARAAHAQGRTDLAKAYGDSAMIMLNKLDKELPDDTLLFMAKADCHNLLGYCAWTSNQLQEAAHHFENELRIQTVLLRKRHSLSQSFWASIEDHGNLGDLARTQKKWNEAESHFLKALALTDSMDSCGCGGSVDWTRWYGYLKLGELAVARNDQNKTENYLASAMQLAESIADTAQDVGANWNVSKTYLDLAQLHLVQGDTAQAYDAASHALALQSTCIEQGFRPRSEDLHQFYLVQLATANLSSEFGDTLAMDNHYREAMVAADTLLRRNPGNELYAFNSATAHHDLINAADDRGAIDDALILLANYREFIKQVGLPWSAEETWCSYMEGWLAEKQIRLEDARHYYLLDRDFWLETAEGDSTNSYARRQAAWTSLDLARVALQAQKPGIARSHLDDAHRLAKEAITLGPKNQESLDLFAKSSFQLVKRITRMEKTPDREALMVLLKSPRKELIDYRDLKDSFPSALKEDLDNIDMLIHELDLPRKQQRSLWEVRELTSRVDALLKEPLTHSAVDEHRTILHRLEKVNPSLDGRAKEIAEPYLRHERRHLPWYYLVIQEPKLAERYARAGLEQYQDDLYLKIMLALAVAYDDRPLQAIDLAKEVKMNLATWNFYMDDLQQQGYWNQGVAQLKTYLATSPNNE